MKPNVIVALLVGLGIGFAVGKASNGGTGENSPSPTARADGEGAGNRPNTPPRAAEDVTVYRVPIDGAPVLGPKDAPVTIVEFSDYQCPFCSRAHATVTQLLEQYGSKVRLVMRQNPLPMHPNAMPSALAALAAGNQGKYWEMHNKLFENHNALDGASLEKYAGEVGLDVSQWKNDIQSPKLKEIIAKDQALAQSLGASGTPAFFINGQKISGAQPIENFKRVIDQELTKAEQLTKQGVPADQIYAKVMEKGITAPPAAPPSTPQAGAVKHVSVPADSPFIGPKHAKVTIVEFSDFQCPFCSRALPGLKQIEQAYPKDVKVVFRHFPLTTIHPHAEPAAEAALAAHAQGKFWAMHDKLFENQGALEQNNFEEYARQIGLNVPKFKAALSSGNLKNRIQEDIAAGTQAGVNGTPTFFINGHQHLGALSLESSKAMIEEEIAKAKKLLAAGTKPEELYEKLLAQADSAPAGKAISLGNAPVKGPKNAPVTIVAFSDFQCPFCGQAEGTLKTIEEKYKGKVRFAFKNDPLPFHPYAHEAAAAALAAHEQGKFWDYHDKLFSHQRELDRASLEKYAQELGLDLHKFKHALDSKKFDAAISADLGEAQRVGANGTPTFFINGHELVGAQPVAAFEQVIDQELSKAKLARASR